MTMERCPRCGVRFSRLAAAAEMGLPIKNTCVIKDVAAEVGDWQGGFEAGMKSAAPAIAVLKTDNARIEAATIERCAQELKRLEQHQFGDNDQFALGYNAQSDRHKSASAP